MTTGTRSARRGTLLFAVVLPRVRRRAGQRDGTPRRLPRDMYINIMWRTYKVHAHRHAGTLRHQRCRTKTGIQTEGAGSGSATSKPAVFLRQNWLCSFLTHKPPTSPLAAPPSFLLISQCKCSLSPHLSVHPSFYFYRSTRSPLSAGP